METAGARQCRLPACASWRLTTDHTVGCPFHVQLDVRFVPNHRGNGAWRAHWSGSWKCHGDKGLDGCRWPPHPQETPIGFPTCSTPPALHGFESFQCFLTCANLANGRCDHAPRLRQLCRHAVATGLPTHLPTPGTLQVGRCDGTSRRSGLPVNRCRLGWLRMTQAFRSSMSAAPLSIRVFKIDGRNPILG